MDDGRDVSGDTEPGPVLALGSTGWDWVLTHKDDKGRINLNHCSRAGRLKTTSHQHGTRCTRPFPISSS